MSLFAGGDKRQAENDQLHAELQRIAGLPLRDLAAEVMLKAFGPDGLVPATGGATSPDIAGQFNPAQGSFGIDGDALVQMRMVVDDGLQVLEHACLVRVDLNGYGDGIYKEIWSATRYGRAALAQNAVTRVLAGGSL